MYVSFCNSCIQGMAGKVFSDLKNDYFLASVIFKIRKKNKMA